MVGPSQLHKPINIHCIAPYTPHMLYRGLKQTFIPLQDISLAYKNRERMHILKNKFRQLFIAYPYIKIQNLTSPLLPLLFSFK